MSRGMRNLLLSLALIAAVGAAFAGLALRRGPRVPPDVRIVAHGEETSLESHLAPGKYTVFDFYAVWCPPCRILGPALERLAALEPERLALRKVDIVDWTMPVARQHAVESLPFLVLYDPDGKRVADGEEVFEALGRVFGRSADEVNAVTGVEAMPEPESAKPGPVL